MNKRISKIENDVQDRKSVAWRKLCDYVEKVAAEGCDEFSPIEELGSELFAQIHTLPESISKLKQVKKVSLYGSKLKRIPPEIGEMQALEYFDPYTSYNLHWFPYEITKCRHLKSSRVSTRVLYGNYKNRMGFPRLHHNPVRYFEETVKCSICGKAMSYNQTNQLWISLWVGSDVLPLLANLCSRECENKIPAPPKDYVQFPHKGGSELKQHLSQHEQFELEIEEYEARQSIDIIETKQANTGESTLPRPAEKEGFQVLKLIRKIWER